MGTFKQKMTLASIVIAVETWPPAKLVIYYVKNLEETARYWFYFG